MSNGWMESDSEAFIRLGEVFTPGRGEILRILLDHIPAGREEDFLAVDVACGAGWVSEAVLRKYPNARTLALDGSDEMLKAAGKLLNRHSGRVELRSFRLEDSSWLSGIEEPVRCFLSSLAIHHLDGPGKRELFQRMLEELEPGGALLFADVVEAASEPGRAHMARAWKEETRRRSREITGDERAYRLFVEDEWNMYKHPDPEVDHPSTIAEQLRWLQETGYEGADTPWVRAGHAIFCAYRPGG